jgi:hypothetical protein
MAEQAAAIEALQSQLNERMIETQVVVCHVVERSLQVMCVNS